MSDKPEHIGLDNKSPVERDRIDLNHEISGEPTGRIQRFLTENTIGANGDEGEKKKSERRYRNMLEYLLVEDAYYAKLYYEALDNLNKARDAVNLALHNINKQLEDAERTLQNMRDRAARLDDGTLVFRSNDDNHVYTEDGRKLSEDEVKHVEFSENAPSWKDFNVQREKVETLKVHEAEIKIYKHDVIDRAQERMHDDDEPPTIEKLEKIEQDIQAKKPEILSQYFYQEGITVSQTEKHDVTVAHDISGRSPLEMPPMSAQFEIARLDIPDIDASPMAGNKQTIAPTV